MIIEDPSPELVIPNLTVLERFWDKVPRPDDLNSCWIWEAGTMPKGYGLFRLNGSNKLAHRVMYRLMIGPIPEGMFVCHNCPFGDNPSCVNPRHFFLGTAAQNQQDMKNKGRSTLGEKHWTRFHPERAARGERNGSTKITEEMVFQIRSLYEKGELAQWQIGEMFGIGQTQVSRIIRGTRWKYLP